MNPIETKTRYIRMAPFIIAVVCFALPFIQISCNGQKMVTLTGVQLGLGTSVKELNPMTGQMEDTPVKSEPAVALTFLCAAAGIGLCFLAGKMGKLLPAIAGAAGCVFMWVAKVRFDAHIQSDGQGMMTLDYVTGFVLTCASLVAGAAVSAFQFSQAKGQAAPLSYAPAYAAPVPPPPPGVGGAWMPPPAPGAEPVSPSGAWAPPTPPPNVEPVSAPTSVPTYVPRQPMSRSTKLALVGAAAAAVVGALGYWTYNYMTRAPGEAAIRQALEARLKQPGQKLVDVSTKIISSSTSSISGGNAQALDLVGQWLGTDHDGGQATYTFRKDGSLTMFIATDAEFRRKFPSGMEGMYSARYVGPFWQIDIKDFRDPELNGFVMQCILQKISVDQFKIDGASSPNAPRPQSFGPDSVVFTRTGGAPAGNTATAGTARSAKTVVLGFTATTELTEAHYVPVQVDQYLRQQGVDLQMYRKISNILNGKGGARIRELAGVTDPPQDLHAVTLLKQTAASGQRNTYTGKIRAVRQGGQWQLVVVEGLYAEKAAPAGRLLADYGNNALALDEPDQAQKVANIISTATDTLRKLEQAQQQYRAEASAAQVPVSTASTPLTPASSISGTWFECEGQHCGQWIWNQQAQQFDAVWSGGAKGTIKVKQNDGSKVVLSRVDQDGVSAGLTANYEGTITGNKIEGTVTWFWQIFDGGQAQGTWKATIPTIPQ